jgi:hypothetical protein
MSQFCAQVCEGVCGSAIRTSHGNRFLNTPETKTISDSADHNGDGRHQ